MKRMRPSVRSRLNRPSIRSRWARLACCRVNLVAAARWLNILAFVASIFIAGWIFYRYSRVPALGIVASALMCAFPYMVWMFGSAYSEPLFVLLFLAGGWGLLAYLQKEKPALLLLSALLIGLIPATRYAGIAMVLAGGGSVLLLASGKTWSAHQESRILFTCLASLPILLWLIWIYFSTAHSVGGRSLGSEPARTVGPVPGLPRNLYGYGLEVGAVSIAWSVVGLSPALLPDGGHPGWPAGAFHPGRTPVEERSGGRRSQLRDTDLHLLWTVLLAVCQAY